MSFIRTFRVRAAAGLLLVLPALALALAPEVPVEELTPNVEQRRATRLITHIISNFHYRKVAIDDALSTQVMDRYLDQIDPSHSYFLRADIDEFQKHATDVDDYLRNAELDEVFAIFIRYRQRMEERVTYANELLDKMQFDFTIDEEYVYDREDAPWPVTVDELNELWRKRVKNDVLSLRLAGKDDAGTVDALRKRYDGMLRRTHQLNSEDVFQLFVNAYATSIDPHTSYFSPRTSENFRIRMSLSLEGIGAVLQQENEFTMVREIVKGGPADESGQLHAGDRIVGIGQGQDEPLVDVIGWRLDDVVDLIRGPKDSVVRLDVLRKGTGPEGPTTPIALVRNEIKLEEQAAKLRYHEVGSGISAAKFAVIELPTFYMDFDARARGDADYTSTTRDVRRLIEEAQQQNISGVIIDLRGNGGGSLTEATELTGLFIDTGPVVQVRTSNGKVQLEQDNDPGVAYSGPLAVLVDRNSASASEIFAGAIQDYGRGLIIGEPTFGKGTVQNLVDLNRFDKTMDGKLGQVKTTIAQFFRVAGGSTQHKGVIPDIIFPTAVSSEAYGERELDNALPFAEIQPARYQKVSFQQDWISVLRAEHERRVTNDEAFKALVESEHVVAELRDKTSTSLLESKRRTEREDARIAQRDRENRLRVARGLDPITMEDLPSDDPTDLGIEEDEMDDAERDAYDVVLHEGAEILDDFVQLAAGNPPKQLVEVAPGAGINTN